MTTFKNSEASHQHSLRTLDSLYEYDDFMDSLRVVADMGCGSGLDIEWWATRETRDDPPEPHNYICYAVDINPSIVEDRISNLSNLRVMPGDFEQKIVPRSIDMLWCHDAFQYVKYPLQTLKLWNECMNPNGMMIITVPQMQSYQYNRAVTIAVYKSNVAPMDPATTSWFDLASAGLLNDSVLESLNRYGHVRQEELLFKWFDKDFYFVKD